MDQSVQMKLKFRCPPEYEGLIPQPVPAVLGLPDWYKAMPQNSFSPIARQDTFTLKKCPPFIDAMTYGFLIPLTVDLKVQDGEFSWDFDVPEGFVSEYSRSPIDFHDPSQATGTPLFDDDRFIIKFTNFWTIEAPQGYSLLFTHPVNRSDLPFTSLTGLGLAIPSSTRRCIFRLIGMTRTSTACCRRVRRWCSACRSSAKVGPANARPCRPKKSRA